MRSRGLKPHGYPHHIAIAMVPSRALLGKRTKRNLDKLE